MTETEVGAGPPGMGGTRTRAGALDGQAATPGTARVPGGRALLGGFLVAAAAVGLFATYTDITAGPSTSYVVAAANLPPGHALGPQDLRTMPVELPDDLRVLTFSDPAQLAGATLLVPRGEGELVQRSDVVRREAPPGVRELTVALDASRALGGRLRPGEVIDVVATYGTGEGAVTVAVVHGARVVRNEAIGGSLVGDGRVQLTVSLARPADALAIAHAVHAGEVTVIRATGADGQLPARYAPGGDEPGRTSGGGG